MAANGDETEIDAVRRQLAVLDVERHRLEARLGDLQQPQIVPLPVAPPTTSAAPVTNNSQAAEKIALFRRLSSPNLTLKKWGVRSDPHPAISVTRGLDTDARTSEAPRRQRASAKR